MNQVIHTKMSDGRRVAIPAELCKEYGLKPGGPVVLESSDAGIVVRPLDAVIREVQAFFADAAPEEHRPIGRIEPGPQGGSSTGKPWLHPPQAE